MEVASMADHLHLVFAVPSPSVTDDQFNEWYRLHLDEILAIPGWLAARRYTVTTFKGSRPLAGFRYLAAYEVGPDIEANMAALLGGKDHRRATSPVWVGENRYASLNAVPVEPASAFLLPADAWFVLSSSPIGVSEEELERWHRSVAESSQSDPRALRSWRFWITPSPVDEAATITPALTHLTVYEASKEFEPPEFSRPSTTAFPWHELIQISAIHASRLTERIEATRP
jgi:hypothetical protein